MIGLSLSNCVKDIIYGKVDITKVSLIVAATKAATTEEFEKLVLDRYAVYYWADNPEYGKAIARKLWEQGRIFQPRLINNDAELNIAHGHWVRPDTNWLLDRQGRAQVRCTKNGREHYHLLGQSCDEGRCPACGEFEGDYGCVNVGCVMWQ